MAILQREGEPEHFQQKSIPVLRPKMFFEMRREKGERFGFKVRRMQETAMLPHAVGPAAHGQYGDAICDELKDFCDKRYAWLNAGRSRRCHPLKFQR